jgi:hypothetical protein
MRCCGVNPSIAEREGVQQVAGGSRQPVKPRHYQSVAGFKRLDHTATLRAVGLGSAHMHVAETLPAPRFCSAVT